MANLSPLVGGAWRYPQVTTDEINSGLSEVPKRWSVKDILDLMAVREPWGDALGEVGEGSGAALQTHKQSGDHDNRYPRLSGGRMTGDFVYRNIAQGTWARGLTGLIASDNRAGGLGILGNGDSIVGVYMGLGGSPWESGNGVRVTASGVAIGGVLSGNGSGLTTLNAGQLTSGTLPAARLSGTYNIAISGNAATATKLQTQRTINGTNFDGTSNITTGTWGTARNLTIGNTAKSVNGSGNVSWTLGEIGAASANHDHTSITIPDSRGAARAPNFFTRRAVRWDFIENAHTGAGGDEWNVLMTVSPWSSFQSTHRQQQIAFVGTGWLKHRHATSDTAWSPWLTILDSGNVSSFAAAPTHNHTWGNITGAPATATRWPSWAEVTGKPGTTASRTDTSTTTLLQAKAMNDHRTSGDHDARYYTKTETNNLTKHHLRFRWGAETITLAREGYITRYFNSHNTGPSSTIVNLTTSTFQVGDIIEIYFLGPSTRTLRINNSNGTMRAPDGSTVNSFATINAPAKVVLVKQENSNDISIISVT